MARIVPLAIALAALACGQVPPEPSLAEGSSALVAAQGQEMQGQEMQGQEMQGSGLETPVQHPYDGWFRGGRNGRMVLRQGELSLTAADGAQVTSANLVGLRAYAKRGSASVLTEIRSVAADPADASGRTFLYALDVIAWDGSRTPLCKPDADGVAAAIPIGALFDASGARVESTSRFTFACTAGVAAKCYRWGYRPWPENGSTLASAHHACTRMARADYCGNGRSMTQNGTLINFWDTLAPQINTRGDPPADFLFEAGWSTKGAVCVSKQRWLTLSPQLAAVCPERIGLVLLPGLSLGDLITVCESVGDALSGSTPPLFLNESRLNLGL